MQPQGRGATVSGRLSGNDVREAITRAHHEEWARVVATLTRRFGDLDIAEEAAAEAFATAVQRWPSDGVPPNPGGWLTTTANRKAFDRIRRESKRDDKQKEAQMLYDDDLPEPLGAIADERLRLIFTCCHPALAMESRIALTLRLVGGLTVPEIARAFLVQESTVGQRITRAKAKIKAARIPYRVPSAEDLPARVFRRARGALPRLQRGLPGDRPRHRSRPARPDRRGDPAHSPDPCPHARRRRGRRTAGTDAPHRGPPHRAGLAERGAGHPRRAGPYDAGTRRWSPRAIDSCASASPRGSLPVDTRSSQRSTPCTPPPARQATPTGRRSSPSTTSSFASTRRRSSPSTGPSRSRSWTAQRWRWLSSTVSRADVDRLPRLPRDPRRPAAPAGAHRGVAGGV